MKNILIGLIIGAVVFIPGTVIADKIVKLPTANQIYHINNDGADIHVFDDQDNKCYVVNKDKGNAWSGDVAISCVKKDPS